MRQIYAQMLAAMMLTAPMAWDMSQINNIGEML